VNDLFPNSLNSIANSSAIFLDKKYHMDFVRLGKALYGLSPLAKNLIGVKNVFSLFAIILQIQTIKKGDSIGYGQTFIAKDEMIVAIISGGYADGIPVQLSYSNQENSTSYMHNCSISFQGKLYNVPIIGKVSMDTMTLDVTALPKDTYFVGQEVEIFGENTLSLNEIADKIQTNVYSVLLNLGTRVRRQYK
jgi:alanine racemase